MRILGVRRSAAVITLTIAGGLMATAPATPAQAATNQPPVAVNDTVHVYAGDFQTVDVVANDSDPDGTSALELCRVGTPSSRLISIASDVDYLPITAREHPKGDIDLLVDPSTRSGTYTVAYQVCDTEYLVPATVTIQVSRLPHVHVVKLRHRPGHLRVRNPSDETALFEWISSRDVSVGGMTRIAPHHRKVVDVAAHKIFWAATTAGRGHHYLGTGVVGHIRLRPGQQAPKAAARTSGTVPRALGRLLHRSAQPLGRAAPSGWGKPWPAATFLPIDLATTVPPTAVPDTRKVWAGDNTVDPLRNDSDPAGRRIEVCRVSVTDRRLGVMNIGGELFVDTSHARNGVHTFTYYACNAHRLAASTVTLTVRHAKRLVVRTGKGHPSHVRVHNPNPARAWLVIGDFAQDNALTVARIRPHHTRWVPVHNRYAEWFATVGQGGNAGYGKLRRIPLTKHDAKADKSRASDLNDGGILASFAGRPIGSDVDALRRRLAAIG